jgi:hypothetical protein
MIERYNQMLLKINKTFRLERRFRLNGIANISVHQIIRLVSLAGKYFSPLEKYSVGYSFGRYLNIED